MKFYSIKTRLTAMYVAIIILLIGCTSLSVGWLSSRALLNQSVTSAGRELALISEKLDLFMTKLETESLYLTRMQDSSSPTDRYQQFLYSSGTLSFLNDFILVQPSVESIAFYDTQGSVLFSDAKSNISIISQTEADYITGFREEDDNSKWISFHDAEYPASSHTSDWVCSFLRKIYSFRGEQLGILELNLNEETIQTIYDVAIADHYNFYILDESGQIISAKDKSKLHMSLEELQEQYPPTSLNALIHPGSEFLYTTLYNEKMKWTLLSTVPTEVILRESRMLVFAICLIGFLAVFLGFILLNSITHFLIHPLIRLTDTVDEIATGNYHIRADDKARNEIGHLASRINFMSENTLSLLDTIQKESALKRQFELSYIQLQMNPHFLYNTLETICGMISVDEKKKAIRMIQNVSGFYKRVLSKGVPIVTVEQELELTRFYLDILQQRYCEIYTYQIQMDPETSQYQLPKLTLQPFVENALIHGILPTGKPGEIIIKSYSDADHIIISIADNGMGMEPDSLEDIRKAFANPDLIQEEHAGFGMISTYQRLMLFLNQPDITITVDSKPGEGTTVRLVLPRRTDKH